MITIDGSYLEGGGQIVRTALALSTFTGKPFKVTNIRKGRKNPGLKAQHLKCIVALKLLCNAEVEGATLGSEEITFIPRNLSIQNFTIDIGTAGSIGLVLQSIIIPILFSGKKIRIELIGGTTGKWAMPMPFVQQVFLPHLKKYCNTVELKIKKRGYFPKGEGIVELFLDPKYSASNYNTAPKINLLSQGKLMLIKGISHASADLETSRVADRQADAAERKLKVYNSPIRIDRAYSQTASTGSGIVLWALFSADGEEINFQNPTILGADTLGEKGISAESVGEDAATKLIKEIQSKASVDSHLADTIIPLMGIVGGEIHTTTITNHTLTSVYVTEQFLPCKFTVDKEKTSLHVKKTNKTKTHHFFRLTTPVSASTSTNSPFVNILVA